MNQIGGNLEPRRQGCLQVGTRGHFAVTVFSLLTVILGMWVNTFVQTHRTEHVNGMSLKGTCTPVKLIFK